MRLEIIIQDLASNWVALDTFGDVPALNFQALDIAELTDRRASYSQAIELPMTDTNVRAFGYANIFEAQSTLPYRRRACYVYVDGVQVIGDGFIFLLQSVDMKNRTFGGQIVSGVKDLFTRWQGKQLSALYLKMPQTFDYIGVVNNNDLGMKFLQGAAKDQGVAHKNSYGSVGPYSGPAGGALRVDAASTTDSAGKFAYVDELMLCVDLMTIMRMIVEASGEGYSFETDIPQMPGYEPIYITPGNGSPTIEDFALLFATVRGAKWVTSGYVTQEIENNSSEVNTVGNYKVPLPWEEPNENGSPPLYHYGWEFETCTTAEYRVRVQIEPRTPLGGVAYGGVRVRVLRYNRYSDQAKDEYTVVSEVSEDDLDIIYAIDEGWTSDTIELGTDDNLHVEVTLMNASANTAGVRVRAIAYFEPTEENTRLGACENLL